MSLSMENPTITDLDVFIGEWNIEIAFPGDPPIEAKGRATFERIEGGAFLVMRSEVDWEGPSGTVSVIGRDDAGEDYTVIYFDARGVSRVYNMSFRDGVLRQWRDTSGFSQRFTGTLSDDGQTMTATWEKSTDGSTWEHDFDLTYHRKTG